MRRRLATLLLRLADRLNPTNALCGATMPHLAPFNVYFDVCVKPAGHENRGDPWHWDENQRSWTHPRDEQTSQR